MNSTERRAERKRKLTENDRELKYSTYDPLEAYQYFADYELYLEYEQVLYPIFSGRTEIIEEISKLEKRDKYNQRMLMLLDFYIDYLDLYEDKSLEEISQDHLEQIKGLEKLLSKNNTELCHQNYDDQAEFTGCFYTKAEMEKIEQKLADDQRDVEQKKTQYRQMRDTREFRVL
ncbi:UNKNOWN [Stylonychia lemnae]|uniref:Uncharacterized protein n=1 Tax=Stylonychia lemnae TaxID=5949 RepID=A0A078A328_STYLE|nr:UNKNOWN [Stylonychia lemnae]|eukprot:CDW76567.1 UNKNOWN [Stylonychia lemnae]